MLAVTACHVLAALKHQWIDSVDILDRMTIQRWSQQPKTSSATAVQIEFVEGGCDGTFVHQPGGCPRGVDTARTT